MTISVVIPTYNGASYISEAIGSVLAQGEPPFELVVSDSGSTDGTLDIICKLTSQAPFELRVVDRVTAGMVPNWNAAALAARGEFIKFLFQDDTLEPNCIARFKSALAGQGVDFAWCDRELLTDGATHGGGRHHYLSRFRTLGRERLVLPLAPAPGTVVLGSPNLLGEPTNKIGEPTSIAIRRSLFKQLGGFSTRMHQLVDLELWYRALALGRAVYLPQKLVNFRLHDEQATINNAKKGRDTDDWRELLQTLAAEPVYSALHTKSRRIVRQHMHLLGLPSPPLDVLDRLLIASRPVRSAARRLLGRKGM